MKILFCDNLGEVIHERNWPMPPALGDEVMLAGTHYFVSHRTWIDDKWEPKNLACVVTLHEIVVVRE